MSSLNDTCQQWYLAKLVFRIVVGEGKHVPHFEEHLRLVHGTDALEAFHIARRIGESEETARRITALSGVQWEFVDITELHVLETRMAGAEVFTRTYEVADAQLHKKEVQRKAGYLINFCTEQFIASI